MNKGELLFKIVYEYFNNYASATKTIKRIMENKLSLLDGKGIRKVLNEQTVLWKDLTKKNSWDNKLYQNIILNTIKLLNLKK
jgi:hypothetical protein